MVQIDDALPYAVPARIDLPVLLSPSARQPVHAEEKSIFCLQDMFFGSVPVQMAKVDKVGCVSDGSRYRWDN